MKNKSFEETVLINFRENVGGNLNLNFRLSTIGEPPTNKLNTTDCDNPSETENSTQIYRFVEEIRLEESGVLSLKRKCDDVNTTEEEKSTRPVITKSVDSLQEKSTKPESAKSVDCLEL